jgi:hypothetical protein
MTLQLIRHHSAAYALTIRVHGSDGQATDKQEMFLLLLPFISQKSTLVLKTLGESIDYVLGNTPEGLVSLVYMLCSTMLMNTLYNEDYE